MRRDLTILAGGLNDAARFMIGAAAMLGWLSGCAAHAGSPGDAAVVKIVSIEVSARALKVIAERGDARVTYEAERGPSIDAAGTTWRRDPENDPPSQSATLLSDRRGHVISISGESFHQPGAWATRQRVTPTRTLDELKQDLAVAQRVPDLLLEDPRVKEWFRWEVRLLRSEVSDLQSSSAAAQ